MDIFTVARFRIAFLYFFAGIAVLGIGAYLFYANSSIEVLVAILVSAFLISYGLAWLTLRPIEHLVDKQKRFMGDISHELRTPLTVMRTNAEATLLGATSLTREELTQALTENITEIDRMAKIIDFLLAFANLKNRLSKMKPTPADLTLAAKKAIDLVTPATEAKGITLTFFSDTNVMVHGNAMALEEMALNLLKNAANYTPENGAITLTVFKKPSGTVLRIQDNGVGISQKDIRNIFDPFFRGNNVGGRKKDVNAGLGLAIVKEIAEIHKATIQVSSEVGVGTTISVKFPRWHFS